MNSAPTIESARETYVRLDTLTDIFRNFVKYLESGDPTALVEQRGWKSGKLVDVIEFIESKEYVGSLIRVWPGVKDNLWQIWKDWDVETRKYEILLTGAIRTGKSMTTQLCLEYCAYLFSQLYNPFVEFDLSPGRKIVIVLQSTTQEKAERILMGPMKADFDASPYFNRHFRRNKDINSKIIFPGDFEVVTVTATDTSAYGENVFSVAVTEANAMAVVKHSTKLRYSNKQEYNQARELWNAVRERVVATFPQHLPMNFGKLLLDSSTENPEDFTHQLIEETKGDPHVLVIHKTIYDAQPESKFPRNEPRFPVEIGDNHHASRLLEWELDAEGKRVIKEARDNAEIEWVPDQLLRFFKADIETALKRFCGIVTAVTGAFLPFKDKIDKAQVEHAKFTGRQSLFLTEEISFLDMFGRREPGEPVDWERLINYKYIDECILDKQVPFSMRIDLSATEDATGFAISRIIGYKMVGESTVWNDKTEQFEQATDQQLPIFMTDGLLRIVAMQGEEIDPDLVAGLGIALQNAGLNIKWGTGDTAESTRAVLIAWKRHKIYCDFLSVDTDLRAYMEAKSAIREERWLFPPHDTADKEFKGVRKVTKNGKSKIDHPNTATGSKDVADAAVGSIFVLHLKERLYRDQGVQGTKGPRGREGAPTPGDYDQSAQRGMTRRGAIVRSGQGKNRLERRLRIVA